MNSDYLQLRTKKRPSGQQKKRANSAHRRQWSIRLYRFPIPLSIPVVFVYLDFVSYMCMWMLRMASNKKKKSSNAPLAATASTNTYTYTYTERKMERVCGESFTDLVSFIYAL